MGRTHEMWAATLHKRKDIIYCSCGREIGFIKESGNFIYTEIEMHFKYDDKTKTCRYCREK